MWLIWRESYPFCSNFRFLGFFACCIHLPKYEPRLQGKGTSVFGLPCSLFGAFDASLKYGDEELFKVFA